MACSLSRNNNHAPLLFQPPSIDEATPLLHPYKMGTPELSSNPVEIGESRVSLILFFNKLIKGERKYAGTILATTAVRTKFSEIEHNTKNF